MSQNYVNGVPFEQAAEVAKVAAMLAIQDILAADNADERAWRPEAPAVHYCEEAAAWIEQGSRALRAARRRKHKTSN